MLQKTITDTLETWKNRHSLQTIESLSKEMEDIKENQMEILEQKNIIT